MPIDRQQPPLDEPMMKHHALNVCSTSVLCSTLCLKLWALPCACCASSCSCLHDDFFLHLLGAIQAHHDVFSSGTTIPHPLDRPSQKCTCTGVVSGAHAGTAQLRISACMFFLLTNLCARWRCGPPALCVLLPPTLGTPLPENPALHCCPR